MNINIVFLLSDVRLARYIGFQKSAVVPSEIRDAAYYRDKNLSAAAVVLDRQEEVEYQLDRYFSDILSSTEGLVVICDTTFHQAIGTFTKSFFFYFFNMQNCRSSYQNFLSPLCSKALRAFQAYSSRFDNEKYRRLLILPTANFRAEELTALVDIFARGVDQHEFGLKIDTYLGQIRARQKPKYSSGYNDVYLVDDYDRYFKYGPERHGFPDTACPPHNSECIANSQFRFGRRFDSGRHFNVSVEQGRISGSFADCHGNARTVQPTSHLNMFPNDFFNP
jgi:hypothetical protein